jgi:hypothetical protein
MARPERRIEMLTKQFQLMLMAYWLSEPRYLHWVQYRLPVHRARAVVTHDRVITGKLLSGVKSLEELAFRI